MTTRIAQPNHIYSPASASLMEHHRTLAWTIDQLMELNGGTEPAKITTDFRDDGPEEGGHNGWMSVIEWPMEARA